MEIWSLGLKKKTGILLSSNRVITTVWLHYLDSIEVIGKNAKWELHKDAEYFFKYIQE